VRTICCRYALGDALLFSACRYASASERLIMCFTPEIAEYWFCFYLSWKWSCPKNRRSTSSCSTQHPMRPLLFYIEIRVNMPWPDQRASHQMTSSRSQPVDFIFSMPLPG